MHMNSKPGERAVVPRWEDPASPHPLDLLRCGGLVFRVVRTKDYGAVGLHIVTELDEAQNVGLQLRFDQVLDLLAFLAAWLFPEVVYHPETLARLGSDQLREALGWNAGHQAAEASKWEHLRHKIQADSMTELEAEWLQRLVDAVETGEVPASPLPPNNSMQPVPPRIFGILHAILNPFDPAHSQPLHIANLGPMSPADLLPKLPDPEQLKPYLAMLRKILRMLRGEDDGEGWRDPDGE